MGSKKILRSKEMTKVKIEVTEDQARVINRALDFYSRIGIGQFKEILEHPTFDNILLKRLTPQKELERGDQTNRGEIVEINKTNIKTKGSWSSSEETKTWEDLKNIRLQPDYEQYHRIKKEAIGLLDDAKKEITGDPASYGIHNMKVDDSCRVAFDIQQVIRHEFWKNSEHQHYYTVDASVSLSTENAEQIKCEISEKERIKT